LTSNQSYQDIPLVSFIKKSYATAIGPHQAPEAPNEKFRVSRLGADFAYRHKREQTNLVQPLRLRVYRPSAGFLLATL
jgi:hypothetical protein